MTPPFETPAEGSEALEQAAASLRRHHRTRPGRPRVAPVWDALDTLPRWFDRAQACCADPPAEASKAAEWLMDNAYHLRRAARQVQADMPAAFYRRLPAAATPEARRLPRVFLAAHGFLAAGHMQVGLPALIRFAAAYQAEGPLSISELWAFPAMLRLACLETVVTALAELFPALDPAFPPSPGAAYGRSHDPTEAVSRAITALSAVSRIDWKAFFEATSHVEAELRRDPGHLHQAGDFATRDSYRKAVEELAQGSSWHETAIAAEAVRLAGAHTGTPHQSHVGWWLAGGGRRQLEALVGFRPRAAARPLRWALAHPGAFYGGMLLAVALVSLVLPVVLLWFHRAGWPAYLTGTALSLMPASIVAVTLANWLVTQLVPPRILPKLDFGKGLPEGCESAVVMPVIVGGPGAAPDLLEQLERHWLTNPDPRLRYALLTDLPDSATETTPRDAAIEDALTAGIDRLNARYAPRTPFVLLHRRRRRNDADRLWMGWERKRGKLEEFNEFLHDPDGAGDAFPVRAGDVAALARVRYVVTLDADTLVPPGAVARLIGALAHPLNRVRFDTGGTRVVAGYTFIQPRIEISPEAGAASIFARLFTGDTAIDIYSRAVSDVYQDLFGEGIFTGKGAYDAAAFRQSLKGRVPENTLVSHDLFEGLHGRAALASDIVFYEDFPARYPDYARRWHRWLRGDWQLLPWLGRYVPVRGGGRARSPLGGLDRWKILDNLRRSLIAPALVLLAAAGWLALPGDAAIWTVLTVATPGVYLLTDLMSGFAHGRRRGTVRDGGRILRDHAGRWFLAVVFMANDALVATDAMLRAGWRMAVSRRKMLEWTSAAHVAANAAPGRGRVWARMAGAPALALALGAALGLTAPAALPGAVPLLLLWLFSPEVAHLTARPRRPPLQALDDEGRSYLRRVARRTWLFFETFAGPDDNWLPPDNYQTAPHEALAHRSSPTNVGMLLLSALAARDLGHIGVQDFATRCGNALATLDRLPHHRGHVLNWFDTRTLAPLEPRYVSTVDSGNLAVSLLTLEQGCVEAAEGPPLSAALWDGLIDTLSLLREAVGAFPAGADLARDLAGIEAGVTAGRATPEAWHDAAAALRDTTLPGVAQAAAALAADAPDPALREVQTWLERARHHVASLCRDLDMLCPWLATGTPPPETRVALARRVSALLSPGRTMPQQARAAEEALTLIGGVAPCDWTEAMREAIARGLAAQQDLAERLRGLAAQAHAAAMAMDFAPLYDAETRTFFTGYNLSFDRIDQHRYDLLASEARLASYVAIAKGDVPAEHWFHLGRPLARTDGALTVLSWNGSMFEYLMPALLLRSDPGHLLGESEAAAVTIQQRYAARLGLPWGVSEAAFAARDAANNYQYRAFGVPGLGLKHGLDQDYVVAPYASALALAVRPADAVANLRWLDAMGLQGLYGFYDSVDFTASRSGGEGAHTPVTTFMAHHQGMLLAAIDNALCDDALVRRFGRSPRVAAMDLLLHERMPTEYVPEPLPGASAQPSDAAAAAARAVPALSGWEPDPAAPQLHALGNGRLSCWVTGRAETMLSWHGQALTGWPGAPSEDRGCGRLHLRDAETGTLWTLGRGTGTAGPDVLFAPGYATFHLHHEGIAATEEIAVAAGDDVEIRRLTLTNPGQTPRAVEVTSHAEVILAPLPGHERHPAFSKLFVRSDPLPGLDGLLFTRRPRRPGDRPPALLHRLVSEDASVSFAGFETDRAAFLGRGMGPPAGLTQPPANGAGWTLDPVCTIRARVELAPGARVQLAFVTVAAGSRETAIETAERFDSAAALDWAFEDSARAHALQAGRLGISQAELEQAQAAAVELMRPPDRPEGAFAISAGGQPDLWALGLSGDLPIVLIGVDDPGAAPLIPVAVRAHHWWRESGLRCDLVILGTGASSYEEPVNARLRDALRDSGLPEMLGGEGGVHLLAADRLSDAQMTALTASARLSRPARAASLAPEPAPARALPPLFAPGTPPAVMDLPAVFHPRELTFDNGTGGFSPDGTAYHITLPPGATTPVPWCNVLANDDFGSIVSEGGLGFTWAGNSGEHRLTPWSNDPVTDRPGEALYLRDEETAAIWSVTPRPAGPATACRVAHGAGQTTWARNSHGLKQRLTVFVPPEGAVKLAILRLVNPDDRPRRVTATYYAEWQLGALPRSAAPHVRCGYHPGAQALVARNDWAPDFAGRLAFLTASRPPHSLSCERRDVLGAGGLARPEGLRRWNLGGRVEGTREACAAFQVHIDLAPNAAEDVVFVLGEGADMTEVEALAARWADAGRAADALQATHAAWEDRLGAVQVETPDPAFDLMVNRWLPYQTLASRVMARAGFNQAGGAYGFRDQLQDMMALVWSDPTRLRAHLLACAAHQFEEGDVLHWWHPPSGRGVRTRCSDDLLWLPVATHRYVAATGDDSVLHEDVAYLSAPELSADEDDRYAAFASAGASGTLFDHCRRALARGVTTGAHGLPLIGAGDWNDGMDRVGHAGRGESLWLAWFAATAARGFSELAERLGHDGEAEHWRNRAAALLTAAENAGWDGDWYLRAYDDDGIPWGSKDNDECRIDSISQSWAVLAGAPDRARAAHALHAAAGRLIDRERRLVRLLDPPFDRTPRDPGYIRAYPPGVRENGGQYTHAAAWMGLALARLGDGDAAHEVFDLINPVRRSATPEAAALYRAEPYVLPADVGGAAPLAGRAGWTWYTGAAAWTWRLGVEGILGLELENGKLRVAPTLPAGWPGFAARLRGPGGTIALTVRAPGADSPALPRLTIDGAGAAPGTAIAFPAGGTLREVVLELGTAHPQGGHPSPDARHRDP